MIPTARLFYAQSIKVEGVYIQNTKIIYSMIADFAKDTGSRKVGQRFLTHSINNKYEIGKMISYRDLKKKKTVSV